MEESKSSRKTFVLDGREFFCHFVDSSTTAAQDDYLLARLRSSGALKALLDLSLDDEHRAEALLTRIMLAGETFHVLAGCLTEVGKKWNRQEADRNAIAFERITDSTEKSVLHGALVGFVLGFFVSGRIFRAAAPSTALPA